MYLFKKNTATFLLLLQLSCSYCNSPALTATLRLLPLLLSRKTVECHSTLFPFPNCRYLLAISEIWFLSCCNFGLSSFTPPVGSNSPVLTLQLPPLMSIWIGRKSIICLFSRSFPACWFLLSYRVSSQLVLVSTPGPSSSWRFGQNMWFRLNMCFLSEVK